MRVEAVLRRKGDAVETIGPDAKVSMAIHRMRMQNVGALVVSRDGALVEGLLSEHDIVSGLTRYGAGLLDMRVSAVMSQGGPVCTPDELLTSVMAKMSRTLHRYVPVVDAGRLCGILSVRDVARCRLEEMELETHVLRDAYLATH